MLVATLVLPVLGAQLWPRSENSAADRVVYALVRRLDNRLIASWILERACSIAAIACLMLFQGCRCTRIVQDANMVLKVENKGSRFTPAGLALQVLTSTRGHLTNST